MSIVKSNRHLFPSLMDEILNPDWFGGLENSRKAVPAVNIREGEKDFQLELVVPGRNKEDFSIEIDNDVLTVFTTATSKEVTVEAKYTRKEFSITSFKRAFTLPNSVDGSKIEASYTNGILHFSLPKKEEALPKPKRSIAL
ncbi:MAG: Hsp20/alpha crystallin family protein [Cellulophaga sp.]